MWAPEENGAWDPLFYDTFTAQFGVELDPGAGMQLDIALLEYDQDTKTWETLASDIVYEGEKVWLARTGELGWDDSAFYGLSVWPLYDDQASCQASYSVTYYRDG